MKPIQLGIDVAGSPDEVFRFFSGFDHAAERIAGITALEVRLSTSVPAGA